MQAPKTTHDKQAAAAQQPPASNAPAAPADEARDGEGDAQAPAGGQAGQGSPAAPVMKQFARTDAESGGDKR